MFSSFWRRRRKRAPRKTRFRAEGIALFACAPLFARNENNRVTGRTSHGNAPRRRSEKEEPEPPRQPPNKDTTHSYFGVKNRSTFGQKRVRKQLRTPSCFQERVGRLFASMMLHFGPKVSPKVKMIQKIIQIVSIMCGKRSQNGRRVS